MPVGFKSCCGAGRLGQCGKTTLSRSFAGKYFDLEQEPERLRLDLEWESLAGGTELVILDEAQSWPEVFPLWFALTP